jgi:hypothetical protein
MTAMAVRTAASRAIILLAAVVRAVAALIGGVILLHAVFVLFEANAGNPLVEFTTGWRDTFAWFTRDLFSTDDPAVTEAINDAVGALIYIVLGSLASKLIVRLVPTARPRA